MPFVGSPVRQGAAVAPRHANPPPSSVYEASEEPGEILEDEVGEDEVELDEEEAASSEIDTIGSEVELEKDEQVVGIEDDDAFIEEVERGSHTKPGSERHWGLLSLSHLRIHGVSASNADGSDGEEGSGGSADEEAQGGSADVQSTSSEATGSSNTTSKVKLLPASLVCLGNSEEAEALIRKYDIRAARFAIFIATIGYAVTAALFGVFGYICVHYGAQLAQSSAGSAAIQVCWTSWGIAVAFDVAALEYLPIFVTKMFDKIARGPFFSGLGSKTKYCHKWYEDFSDLTTLEMLQHNNGLEALSDGVNAVKHGAM